MIKQTHIPFIPRIRLNGDNVEEELYEEIERMAKRYNKKMTDFEASFELRVDPGGEGHYFIADIIYIKGKL